MFPRSLQQGIASTNVTGGAGRPITQAHYAAREREPQIVRVVGREGNVQVCLPQLEPNFTNLSDTLANRSSDIFYQFRSFRYFNRFYNIGPDDYLELRGKIRYTSMVPMATITGDITTYSVPFNANFHDDLDDYDGFSDTFAETHPMRLYLNPDNYDTNIDNRECLSGDEIAARLNESARILLQMLTSPDPETSAITKMYPTFNMSGYTPAKLKQLYESWLPAAEACMHGQFAYDNASGKIAFIMSGKYQAQRQLTLVMPTDTTKLPYFAITPSDITSANGTNKFSVIYQTELYITVPESAPMQTQQRLNYCLGIGTIFQRPSDWNSWHADTNEKLLGVYMVFTVYDFLWLYGRNIKPGAPTIDTFPYHRLKRDIVPQVIRYFDFPLKLSPHDKLHIRTSLRTNQLDYNGRRTDVMLVAQVQGADTNTYVEYMPATTAGRDYNCKDTLASLKSFQVRITDEDGNDVPFIYDWELTIGIFFQHADPMLLTL